MSTKIYQILSREILDSRGNPTVEVEIQGEKHTERACVPSGASTGMHEALELRDGDKNRYLGKGCLKAVENVNKGIAPALKGKAFSEQKELDRAILELDGTENKSKFGANALLGVSMAFARLKAREEKKHLFEILEAQSNYTLPVPLMNLINGGQHADNTLDFQEFMIAPHGFERFSEALRAGAETFHALKKILLEKNLSTGVGDEGGFAPNIASVGDAIRILLEAIEKAGYRPDSQISVALDVASSEFYKNGSYGSLRPGGTEKTASEMIGIYKNLKSLYPVISIEDGLAEEDWSGWTELTKEMGQETQLVGDDIFVTNPKFLKRGIDEKSANSILIKLNQIGTVTETLETIQMAKKAGFTTVISHRSGETEDTFISDLAVGTNAGQIKTGSLSRTDRIAKYNQLLRIEETLGSKAIYSGSNVFKR